MKLFFVFFALMAFATQLKAHDINLTTDQSCARYVGNAGVLISSNNTKVLFDAFYTQSFGQYTLVPETTQQALMANKAPYDNVTALFISHVHGDHFSPGPTLEYLRANPDVSLYASRQVVDTLQGNGDDITKRLVAFELAAGDPAQSITAGDLSIDVVRIPHSGGERTADIENLAFRVSLSDELTVLHLGDADPNEQLFSIHKDHWRSKKLDIAFPPYWFLSSATGQVILNDWLQPAKTIGVHVPIAAAGNGDAWRSEQGGDLFTDPNEIRAIRKHGCVNPSSNE